MDAPTVDQSSYYRPYTIEKTNTLTPNDPQFHSFDLNLTILTKYGKYVFIRHGDDARCSSFCATLCTIVNKLQLSFGKEGSPATLKKFKQGILQFYAIKRCNFLYIFWSKGGFSDLRLYSMVELLHYQLMSSLTSKVNAIIDQNQTYNPTVNFGRSSAVVNLLQYALHNGLHSIPCLFNCVPIMVISSQVRNQIANILNVKQYKTDGLQVSILMTMNCVVGVSKKKGIDIETKDLFLFFNLIQAQSLLSKSQNWFPICLPGIQPESMIFCYLNFIDKQLVHAMISDQSDIFPKMSEINKQIKQKLQNANLLTKLRSISQKAIIQDSSFEKSLILKHFVVLNQNCEQMIMSKGQYFGDNKGKDFQSQSQFDEFLNIYAVLIEHLLTVKHYRKEKLHVQCCGRYIGGYYQQSNLCIFFIISKLSDLEQAKNSINSIIKFLREEELSLFIGKY